ncbi:MAG: HigA family addiction module antitoxin [Bacteroidota bacterium]
MEPMGISPYRLAKNIKVDQTRISQVLKGDRSLSADTAIRLGIFFSMSPEFWMNLQAHFDLEEEREV